MKLELDPRDNTVKFCISLNLGVYWKDGQFQKT